jgi:hypothetical protein
VSCAVLPRLIRYRDAPGYLGMDRNRFDAEVRPQLTEVPMGPRSIVFDRHDLDDWREGFEAEQSRLQEADREQRVAANVRARSALRRAAEIQQTPAWADKEEIKAVYLRAVSLSAATGIPHHVDHIYPLRGRLVSGLHVAGNLQVLTATANLAKKNHFEVEP